MSTKVPYKSVGEEYISADFEELNNTMRLCYGDVFRKVRDFISKRERYERNRKRVNVLKKYLEFVIRCTSETLNKPQNKCRGDNRMKSFEHKAKCNDRILRRVNGIDVMLGLTEFILDVFVESLKNTNPKITNKEIEYEIKRLLNWKLKYQSISKK